MFVCFASWMAIVSLFQLSDVGLRCCFVRRLRLGGLAESNPVASLTVWGASHDFFLKFSVCAFLSFGALVLVSFFAVCVDHDYLG